MGSVPQLLVLRSFLFSCDWKYGLIQSLALLEGKKIKTKKKELEGKGEGDDERKGGVGH